MGVSKALEAWPGRGGVAMAVGRGHGSGAVSKAVRAWQMPWGRGQGRWVRGQSLGGVAKAVVAWPRLWRHGQRLRGVAKAVGAWPRP